MRKLTEGEEIGKRLRDWCLSKYSTLGEAADALKILQVHLSAYMAGRNIPGNKLQGKLRALGCNVEWLMTGKTPDTHGALRGITLYPTYSVQTVPPTTHGTPVSEVQEGISLEYPARHHVWLKVGPEAAKEMSPMLLQTESCLISLSDEARSGDLVAARWGAKSVIRLCEFSDGNVLLKALNPTLPVIVLERKTVALFRVVLIKKR